MDLIRLLLIVTLAAALTLAAEDRKPPEYAVEIHPQYVVPAGERAERGSVSPDGRRLAVWISVGERGYVWCDGRRSRMWDAVLLPRFNIDGSHVAYIGLESTGADSYNSYVVFDTAVFGPFTYLAFDRFGTDELVFSPDGCHLAFRAWDKKEAKLYFDGRTIGAYSNIAGPPPTFSLNSERLACHVADSLGGQVLLDGTLLRRWSATAVLAGFSDNSRSFSYLAISADSSEYVVIDSTTFGPYQRVPIAAFRPKSRDLWFVASKESSAPESVYVNGEPMGGYSRVLELAFSDDGRRWGLVAEESPGRFAVVIDSGRHVSSERVLQLSFGPYGHHAGYRTVSVRDSATMRQSLIVDGHTFGPFLDISPISYSPDGRHYLFASVDTLGAYHLFTDSAQFGPYDSAAVVGWSPDSRQYAFTVSDSGLSTMVINGSPGRSYQRVMRQAWFDTLSSTAAYIADPAGKGICLVVADSAYVPLDFYFGSGDGFDSNGELRGYGQRGDTIVQYIVRRISE